MFAHKRIIEFLLKQQISLPPVEGIDDFYYNAPSSSVILGNKAHASAF